MRSVLCSLVFSAGLPCSYAATLSGNFVPLPSGSAINLSAEGTLDWAHWGLTSPTDFNHLASTNQIIGDYILIGSQFTAQANSFPNACSWTNGTPVASATGTTTAVYVTGLSNGFQVVIGAGTSPRRLRLYLGALVGRAELEASLSDASAASYVDDSLDSSALTNGVYLLDYAAGSAGQTLAVKFTLLTAHDAGSAATVLQAATLAPIPNVTPLVSLTSPTNEAN